MPPPTTCWAPAQSSSLSTQCQKVLTIINYYQVICLFKVSKKSPFQVTLQDKWLFGYLWLSSRIRAHNKLSETGQLLGLFQYICLFALYQPSSSN